MAICIFYNFVIYTFVSTFFYTYYEIDHSYTLCSRALLNSNFVVFWFFFFRKKVDKFTCGDSRVCLIAPILPESLTDLGNVSMLSEWQWIQWMISKRVKHKKHLKKKRKQFHIPGILKVFSVKNVWHTHWEMIIIKMCVEFLKVILYDFIKYSWKHVKLDCVF